MLPERHGRVLPAQAGDFGVTAGLLLGVQPAPVIRVFFSEIPCATETFVMFQLHIVTLKLALPVPANTEFRCIPAYSSALAR
jgi:hypothetical protein